ncbi:MAG: GTP cyclohydrolase MptA [Halococcoides sp.]
MGSNLPDVQATDPDVAVGLTRVGVTGVEKLLKLGRADRRPIVLMAEFSVYVDLPSSRKGADMSRNMEVIDEVLEAAVAGTAYRVEDVCGDAAERLLDKHEYTERAEVRMEADYMMRERTPESDRPTQATATIHASATADASGTRESIGAEVTGMTVCPCSQGMSAAHARETLTDLGVEEEVVADFLDAVPQAGHSQRGRARLSIETDGAPPVDLNDLIEVARDAMSARIYNLAKRPDEDHMTREAHADAKFVEDCVRAMADGVLETFPDLSDDAVVRMIQTNEESIHQHDAHAEREARVETLRSELTE